MTDLNSTGAVLATYAQGSGVDEPLAATLSGTLAFYEADGLGSITSLTSSSGSAVGAYIRDSFGKAITTSDTLGNRFRYTAREWDEETGLYYYRARYYDPQIGRFGSEDPAQFRSGFNFYTYVLNNPALNIDPSGLDWFYHQSTGNMEHVDNQTGSVTEVCVGYAGHNFGLNNPLAQDIPGGPRDSDAGPPMGGWAGGAAFSQPTCGCRTRSLP